MFQQYYGFTQLPFSKSIPTADLFDTAAQKELAARLTYLVREQGFGLLTGEFGSGTLAPHAVQVNPPRSALSRPPSMPIAIWSPISATPPPASAASIANCCSTSATTPPTAHPDRSPPSAPPSTTSIACSARSRRVPRRRTKMP